MGLILQVPWQESSESDNHPLSRHSHMPKHKSPFTCLRCSAWILRPFKEEDEDQLLRLVPAILVGVEVEAEPYLRGWSSRITSS